MTASEIVNTAQAGWKVIEQGRTSSALATGRANAVPHVEDWQSLTDVRGPQEVAWRLHYANGFGQDVVDIWFVMRFDHSARYRGGGGFIDNMWLDVPACNVLWGYNIDFQLYTQPPENHGSETAPVACLPVTISGSISTPLWTDTKQWSFALFGNGAAQVL